MLDGNPNAVPFLSFALHVENTRSWISKIAHRRDCIVGPAKICLDLSQKNIFIII